MSFLNTLKAKLGPAKEKVGDLAQQHGPRIDQGIDKAARAVDSRTKGRYSRQIRTGSGKAKEALDRVAGKEGGGTGTTPPPPPPAA